MNDTNLYVMNRDGQPIATDELRAALEALATYVRVCDRRFWGGGGSVGDLHDVLVHAREAVKAAETAGVLYRDDIPF